MNVIGIKKSTRAILVALATFGLLMPTTALPCCGCCSMDAVEADLATSADTRSCCASKPCCSAETTGSCPAEQASGDRCCTAGTKDCNKPVCGCSVLPISAVALALRENSTQNQSHEHLALATPCLAAAIASPFDDYSTDRVSTPPLGGTLRTHARLCVWLN